MEHPVADDMGEKSEDPTFKKLSDARGKGQVAKSQDLSGAIILLAAIGIFAVLGPMLAQRMMSVTRGGLESFASADSIELAAVEGMIRDLGRNAVFATAPVMVLMFLAAALANVSQIGFLFSTKALELKLSKLNPIEGTKKLFSKRSLFKTGINLVKLVVMVVVSVLVLTTQADRVLSMPAMTVLAGTLEMLQLLAELAIVLVLLLLAMGMIDLIFQKWQHKQDLRMTKHEVKEERRTMEGDPQIKGRRARMMQEIASQRAQVEVPKADVIVTNPTHYSVALRYDSQSMRAPRVVAKGVDHLALRIRHIARTHGVAIVERPPLARGLYFGVDVGREVPAEFYEAIAEVLAFVYRLEQDARGESENIPEPESQPVTGAA